MKVVAVVLTSAAVGLGSGSGFAIGQALIPSVVLANADEQVSSVIVEGIRKELCTGADIEVRIAAVSSRCATALLLRDLHQALFTSTTNSVGIARALLHSKRSKHNGREAELCAILFKHVNELGAGLEWALAGSKSGGERYGDDISDPDEGGIPTTLGKSTVEPVDATVGTRCTSGLSRSSDVAAVGWDVYQSTTVIIGLGRLGFWLRWLGSRRRGWLSLGGLRCRGSGGRGRLRVLFG